MHISSCSLCEKSVNHRSSIKCNLCQTISHLKCNDLNYVDGLYLKNLNILLYCRACCADIFPFTNINNYNLYLSLNNTGKKYCETFQKKACLVLKPQKNLSDLFNEFNNFSDHSKNQENVSNCKYYDLNEIKPLNKLINKSSVSLFHLNTCSLSKNFEDLEYLLHSTNLNFDVIAISETRITKNKAQINHIDLTNYSYEHCPTESSAGGTLLYIRNHLSYKTRNDLNIYKSSELESTFIEIINHKKSNIIVGCIYRHPAMDLNEFNDYYLNELLL